MHMFQRIQSLGACRFVVGVSLEHNLSRSMLVYKCYTTTLAPLLPQLCGTDATVLASMSLLQLCEVYVEWERRPAAAATAAPAPALASNRHHLVRLAHALFVVLRARNKARQRFFQRCCLLLSAPWLL